MTHFPTIVKYVAVSTTMSPVTQMAEVEVKRASTKEIRPETVQTGSMRSRAPKKMAAAKLIANTWAGWNSLSLWGRVRFLLFPLERNLVFHAGFVNHPGGLTSPPSYVTFGADDHEYPQPDA
jgi:hypothetical protein